jgi:hypothetical protein
MKRLVPVLAATLSIAIAGCSAGGATGGLGTLDAGATRACQGLQGVIQDRAALTAQELRERLGTVYTDAQSSSNAIIQARAVALYADATVIASGGEPGSLDVDLNSMQQACSGAGS